MKLKRRAIEDRYRERISELYEEAEAIGMEREKSYSQSV